MLKKLQLLCTTLFLLTGATQVMAVQEIPHEFTVTQHWFSFTTSFSIGTKNLKLGTVHRRFFSLSLFQYDFYDNDEVLQATGRMRWFSWGPTFDVEDAQGQSLGRIEQKFSWILPTFDIISSRNLIQAEVSLNFWGTTFTVVDPLSQQTIATMHRNFFRLKDDWTVNIVNPQLFIENQLDNRFFILVMAFQSDREAWKRKQDANDYYNNNASIRGTLTTEQTAKKNGKDPVDSLRAELKKCRKQLAIVEPTDEDFEAVDQIVTTKMLAWNTTADEEESEFTYLQRGVGLLLPMLFSDELTDGQKCALYQMLKTRLN